MSLAAGPALALLDYDLVKVEILKVNKKTCTVRVPAYKGCVAHTKRLSHNKIVSLDTPFCVVWDMATCARGSYHIETAHYKSEHKIGWRDVSEYVRLEPDGIARVRPMGIPRTLRVVNK